MCPPLFRDSGKVPLSCNMVAFLENSEYAKMNRKIQVSSDLRSSKFQNFWGSVLRIPLAGLHLGTDTISNLFHREKCLIKCLPPPPDKELNIITRNPLKVPSIQAPFYLYDASYVPGRRESIHNMMFHNAKQANNYFSIYIKKYLYLDKQINQQCSTFT